MTTPTAGSDHRTHRRATRRVLTGAMRSERRALAATAVLAVAAQGCEVAVPVVVGVVIDRAVGPGDAHALMWSLAGLALVFAVRAVAGSIGFVFRTRAIVGAAHAARMTVVGRVLAPAGPTRSAGSQLSVTSSDADAVGQAVTAVVFMVSGVAAVLGGLAVLLTTSPVFAVVLVVSVPIALTVSRLAAAPLERRTVVSQHRTAAATALVTDLCSGLRVLRGIGAGPVAADRYRAESGRARRASEDTARASGAFEGLSEAAIAVSVLPVVWIGGLMVVRGGLTVGALVAVVGLVTYLTGQTYRFTEAVAHWATARASAGRVAAVLGSGTAAPAGPEWAPPVLGEGVELELRGVVSGPLRCLDLRVGVAEMVGVVCASAREADALVDLLACRVPADGGRYLVAGLDVADLDVASVRATVLVEPHHGVLLGSTVIASVTDTARGDIEAALRTSGADEVLRTLPNGPDTPVGERGSALSGGQRQRVVLARALAADPPVLVLRDPTTAIDTVTETRIASRLATARPTGATVLVTSSPALLTETDRVVLVKGGRVVAAGEHETLLRTVPAYRAVIL